MFRNKHLQIISLTGIVIVVQLLITFTGKTPYLTQLTMTGYYSMVIIGLTLLMGYTGQISLGHAGFFAIGGYTSAFLTTFNMLPYKSKPIVAMLNNIGVLIPRKDLYEMDILTVSPWAACIAAVLLTVVIAWVIGRPVLKLKGHYLAMATLGFGTIIYKIVLGTTLLGAADGLSDIPGFILVSGLEVSGKSALRIENYYIAWGLVIISVILLTNLVNSRVGRALRSIHAAEDASNAMGVNTAQYKLKIFILSAALAALGGVFLTHFNGGIGPSEASIMKSVRYVAIVAIGGMANLWGALFMGVLLNFLSLRGYLGSYDDAVFGIILILIMLFAPNGLLRKDLLTGILDRLKRLMKKKGAAA
jgi:branched-chain amino acid transport system permease protein